MILHMDNVLIGGDPYNTEFNGAGDCELQKNFNFGKWDQLSETSPIKYCGGIIELKDGVGQTS